MHIAIASYQQESNTLSPLPALRQSFNDSGYGAARRVLARVVAGSEWEGALGAARGAGDVTPLPVWAAHAVSGGVIPAALHIHTLAQLVERLEAAHRADALDGILLILHGATVADGCDDVAGATLGAVRQRFGDDMPVVATIDLHANVTATMVAAADALVPYHTYPHVDLVDTGARAMRLLLRLVRGIRRPARALRRLPLIAPPDNAATVPDADPDSGTGRPRPEPLVDVFARGLAWENEAAPGTRSIGICPVQPWLNVPDLGSSVFAYAATETEAATIVSDLADRIWRRRAELFDFPLLPAAAAVDTALAAPCGPFLLSDAADSTGSGATGDGTAILEALLGAADRRPSLVPMVDAAAVAACHAAGPSAEIELYLGASLDPRSHRPVRVRGRVHWVGDGSFQCEGPQWHGRRMRGGRAACLRVGRYESVSIVVTERPCFVWDPGFYRMAGLDVRAAQVVVVKSAVAYRAAFAGIAAGSISVDGPGASPSNLHRIEAELGRVRRPLFPFDVNTNGRVGERTQVMTARLLGLAAPR